MTEAKSVAVWCLSREGERSSDIEVHFNYWRLRNSKPGTDGQTRRDFLEVGLQVYRPSSIEEAHIYLPFRTDPPVDLGPHFSNPSIAQGIFNQPLDVSQPQGGKWIDLTLTKPGRQAIRVYCFDTDDIENDVGIAERSGGTILTIGREIFEQFPAAGDMHAYFRFRVYMPESSGNPLVRVIKPPDRLWVTGFDAIEFVDFRYNDARTLPDSVERLMRKHTDRPAVRTRVIAFLTAVPLQSEMTVSHAEVHKIRRLENTVWDSHVSGGIPDDMIVYHWKDVATKSRPLSDFSAFVKLRHRRSGWKVVLPYATLGLLIGIFGNLLAQLAWEWFFRRGGG